MSTALSPKLEASWKKVLANEFEQSYMFKLKNFLQNEKQLGKTVYPKGSEIFAAFNLTPFEQVKVVILGQDPYHGLGQAHGLSFSVLPDVKVPPSLNNMYKELSSDVAFRHPGHGYLENWAKQGVLLLNSVLTVRHSEAYSHRGQGWEELTDAAISCLSQLREGIIFLCWGSAARAKAKLINANKHYVLTAPHPSPLSAHRGFLGCKHFSKTNQLLAMQGKEPIYWQL
ncbi:Uracil-DNA glycosylase [Piscirickettsia salmonis]|uniref:uracil-DNA glycosylase n=1 Tax=Piscirickettsia salmonis TaxID=1238 RepID=UPI0012B93B73|nr:uracil-DNA glycosylase [Piscirickettsia salmonis]QGP51205.1 Uracil-DNA glycosylase [Piscirickettsia salmonis]QGP53598.1 Uracil-DNA glycosylase [Piscirickettsia salmonis]QGP60486.1 Uracil-DNA glycosylase [Piscirickettsia salmonis]QGP63169.1 Uracil-DNA glycosylase [Piscirickettsia salmonis]